MRKVISWGWNVNGAVRGKPGPAGIEGVLYNDDGTVLAMFSKHVGAWMESNEAGVFAILQTLQIPAPPFLLRLWWRVTPGIPALE